MRIVITGGAGFIGSHIAEAAVGAGHDVLVVDDLSSGHTANIPAGADFHLGDIRSDDAAAAIEAFAPDALCHHAAQMNVRYSVADPVFDAGINVLGTLNVVEAARRAGCGRVVFASSGGTVYGDPEVFPTDEEQPRIPVCPYGRSKLAGEHYLEYYARVHGLHYVALRYANVYGPRQDPHGEAGVIAIFAEKLLGAEVPSVFGDGLQTRDYVYVGDVVRANLAALVTDFCGPVNIATGVETSVVELAGAIEALVGSGLRPAHVEAKAGEARRSVLNCDRARTVLGWEPQMTLAQGLAPTVEFFRAKVASCG